MAELFVSARSKVLAAYEAAGQPFVARTVPYHSTRWIEWQVVDTIAAAGVAFAVARAGQRLALFNYGVGSPVVKRGVQVAATEADTNQGAGKSTNGAEDYIIEGVGLSSGGYAVRYAEADHPAVADADVVAALNGNVALCDPAALIAPPQVGSPFNLETALFQACAPMLALSFEFDRKGLKRLGKADLLPQAGASSYLRANGEPSSANRWRIPEGFLWRRDGQPDSEFTAFLDLEEAIVCPINLVTMPGAEAAVTPTRIYLDVTMRLFGLGVDLPSEN